MTRNSLSKFALAATVAAFLGGSAHAAVIADFELNGTTANAVAGSSITLTTNGGSLGATGITFGINQGPTVSGLASLAAYTIDIGFTLNQLTGVGTDYVKLIDFSALMSDAGYYSFRGYLSVYPLGASDAKVFAANTPVRLTLSRDNAGLVTGYIDGNQIFSASDPTNRSATQMAANTPLNFFVDDRSTSQREAAAGFVDYIRIADTALTPGQITPTPAPAVPEPATWAIMVLGFGGVGHALRRKPVRARVRFA